MTPKQYKRAIAKLGMTQIQAAEFFGNSGRQGQRWATGERPVPLGVAIALRLMLEHGKTPDDLKVMVDRWKREADEAGVTLGSY